MSKHILSTIAIFLVFLSTFNYCSFNRCNQETWNDLAKGYTLAITSPEDFINFVQDNKEKFQTDTPFHKCTIKLGTAIMESAIKKVSVSDIRESAYNIASDAGRPELAEPVINQVIKNQADFYRYGEALVMTSKVIEEILNGNKDAYFKSELYVFCQIWKMVENTFGQSLSKDLSIVVLKINEWYIRELANQM